MTTTETTKPNPEKTTGWAEAAAASAAAQEPGDPPPKKFRARLTTKLTDREFREHGQKLADITAELDEFESETKQIMADRKATKAEIDGRRRRELQILSTGREDRDVECVEHVSLRQGRKWRVRLDTNETYEEQPLSDGERQASLPMELVNPDDPEDGQLRPIDTASVEEREPVSEVEEEAELAEESPIDVTDPDALLAAAEAAPEDASAEAEASRPTRSRKPKKD
jgi:hypothetical protein